MSVQLRTHGLNPDDVETKMTSRPAAEKSGRRNQYISAALNTSNILKVDISTYLPFGSLDFDGQINIWQLKQDPIQAIIYCRLFMGNYQLRFFNSDMPNAETVYSAPYNDGWSVWRMDAKLDAISGNLMVMRNGIEVFSFDGNTLLGSQTDKIHFDYGPYRAESVQGEHIFGYKGVRIENT